MQLAFLCPRFCLMHVDAWRWRSLIFNMVVFHDIHMPLSEHNVFLSFILLMDLGNISNFCKFKLYIKNSHVCSIRHRQESCHCLFHTQKVPPTAHPSLLPAMWVHRYISRAKSVSSAILDNAKLLVFQIAHTNCHYRQVSVAPHFFLYLSFLDLIFYTWTQ